MSSLLRSCAIAFALLSALLASPSRSDAQPTGGPTHANVAYDRYRSLYVEFSPYNHVDGADPPLFMSYDNKMQLPAENASHGIHHPVFGVKLKEKADAVGHECHLSIEGVAQSEEYATPYEFLTAKLLSP